MSDQTKRSWAQWGVVLFVSAALAMMINVVGFFILLMFVQQDGDALVKRYLVDENYYFVAVSLVLMLLLIPLVKRIPNKLE